MNKKLILHLVMLAVTAAIGGVVDHLTQSHAVWAPVAVALLTDLKPLLASIGNNPPSGPAVVGIALVAIVGGSWGCWLTKPPPVTPSVPDGGFVDASAGTTFIDCSEAAIHQAAVNLLPTIETGLATGNLDAALVAAGVNLAAPLVLAEVACGVQYVVHRITHMQGSDPLENTKLGAAQAWQAAHPVTFK